MVMPELLAPAGCLDSLRAAVANGADAVYFGIGNSEKDALENTFNARARAKNIPLEKLRETMDWLRKRCVKGYVTLNTLVFSNELSKVETILREINIAGVDAILVQDLGVARLAREICPDLPLHASTQMSLTAVRGIEHVRSLGISRVVLPRELSLDDIRLIKNSTQMELECFVHGALCMSFSGQCFASFALGGRSANRGRCAQPCRLAYTLLDGNTSKPIFSPLTRTFEEPKQLLSPSDLATLLILPQIVAAGVNAIKIEGRLKPPEYVAEVTRVYRKRLDQIAENNSETNIPHLNCNEGELNQQLPAFQSSGAKNGGVVQTHRITKTPSSISAGNSSPEQDLYRLEILFSRGFSTGWLEGIDSQNLVPGNVQSHRGSPIGTVVEARRDAVVVRLSDSVRRGDGVMFLNETRSEDSQGGRIFEIKARQESLIEAEAGRKVLLTFANESIDSNLVFPGQSVRKTSDPRLEREIQKSLNLDTIARPVPLDIVLWAKVGTPLRLKATAANGAHCEIEECGKLETARKHPASVELVREQMNRLGGTIYELNNFDVKGLESCISEGISGGPMIPLSLLGSIRHRMLEALDSCDLTPKRVVINETTESVRNRVIATNIISNEQATSNASNVSADVIWHKHIRDIRLLTQLESDSSQQEKQQHETPQLNCRSYYVECADMSDYKKAAEILRNRNDEFVAVLPRIVKPKDGWLLNKIAKLKPDAVLARNLETFLFFRERDIPVIADCSFNVVNELSFQTLLDWGAQRIALSWDASETEIESILQFFPAEKVEQIVLGRIPMFMMEHCLWRRHLIQDDMDCKQMCQKQPLKIQDRYGALHRVQSDILCRNWIESSELIDLRDKSFRVGHVRIEWSM
ncbi:MAG: DUF3656 domain-containing U32 family peptidase [Thermoguttaceae bacterium]